MRALSFHASLLSVLATSAVAAAQSDITYQRLLSDSAYVSANASSGICTSWSITLWASEQASRASDAPRTGTKTAHIDLSGYSYCTGVSSEAHADVALPGDISLKGLSVTFSIPIDNTLLSYGDDGTTQVQELAPGTFNGSVTLKGQGAVTKAKDRSFSVPQGESRLTFYKGQERAAQAVFKVAVDGEALDVQPSVGAIYTNASITLTSAHFPKLRFRPLPPPKGHPTSSFRNHYEGAMAGISHLDGDPGCIATELQMTALETNTLSEPSSEATARNFLNLELSQEDQCTSDRIDSLILDLSIPDVVDVEGTLDRVSVSVDAAVPARRCSYIISTGVYTCQQATVQLDLALFWEGTGDLLGGTDSGTSRDPTSIYSSATNNYVRVATLTRSFKVDGQELTLSGSLPYASLLNYTSEQSTTTR